MKKTLNYIFGTCGLLLGCMLDTPGFVIEALLALTIVILVLINRKQ